VTANKVKQKNQKRAEKDKRKRGADERRQQDLNLRPQRGTDF
jgi:hypothetical protein